MLEVGCNPDSLPTNYQSYNVSYSFHFGRFSLLNDLLGLTGGHDGCGDVLCWWSMYWNKKCSPLSPITPNHTVNLVQHIFFKCPSRSIAKDPSPSSSLFHVKVAGYCRCPCLPFQRQFSPSKKTSRKLPSKLPPWSVFHPQALPPIPHFPIHPAVVAFCLMICRSSISWCRQKGFVSSMAIETLRAPRKTDSGWSNKRTQQPYMLGHFARTPMLYYLNLQKNLAPGVIISIIHSDSNGFPLPVHRYERSYRRFGNHNLKRCSNPESPRTPRASSAIPGATINLTTLSLQWQNLNQIKDSYHQVSPILAGDDHQFIIHFMS